MMLLTKENLAALPPLYANEDKSADEVMVAVKFFMPSGRATFYATEFDGDDTFFGYVVSPLGSDCDELGYFSLSELKSVRGAFGLGIERDRHFGKHTLREVMDAAERGGIL